MGVAALLPGVRDQALDAPTPCAGTSVAALLSHLYHLSEAFRGAAEKLPDAREGMTSPGGLEMPAAEAGVVGLDEIVLHGWDLARVTVQSYQVDPETSAACIELVAAAARPEGVPGLFGPPVPVPDDAPTLDRLVGLSGRDPSWRPPQ